MYVRFRCFSIFSMTLASYTNTTNSCHFYFPFSFRLNWNSSSIKSGSPGLNILNILKIDYSNVLDSWSCPTIHHHIEDTLYNRTHEKRIRLNMKTTPSVSITYYQLWQSSPCTRSFRPLNITAFLNSNNTFQRKII